MSATYSKPGERVGGREGGRRTKERDCESVKEREISVETRKHETKMCRIQWVFCSPSFN
jgi:hypothetical protein